MVLARLLTRAREATSVARQAMLLPRDTLAPVIPRDVGEDEDVVVFLHGLFASAGVLRPMRQRIGRHHGIHTAALSYPPGPSADWIAERLGELLAELPAHCRIHLVGHSLGGIVARYFAVRSDDTRIVSTIALASPFGGVRGVRALGFPSARDLDTGSPLLRALRVERPTRHIPHLSVIAGEDALTRTPVSHALPDGEVVVVAGIGHNAIVFDRTAIRHVEERILSVRRRSSHVRR